MVEEDCVNPDSIKNLQWIRKYPVSNFFGSNSVGFCCNYRNKSSVVNSGAGGSTTVKIEEVRREERRLRRIIGFQEDEERRGFIEQLRMDTSVIKIVS
ncbi:hypothetical protein Zmor_019512 [Zophobas morio]|uniref:Uncharacterized protein n=1 Tax=Zophobas morio TaxID=2755281 RepID=A0AA38M9E7_9CUCU|nr:hypothetical protein Zmor_019512 [Zophobas morio]